ncbi:cation:proton antiporter [Pelagicoccus sp. SDUM812002]|uniref:cation:proton antiporter n=1 Tax=Pelagicoccus sp. SDUM812002 TaxID=3041266 RepID=UPI00280D9D88|nr:cation:proton antiporter [Pelagicoccus sp. SDUM812002]MDQ8187098.1 cation:proton antiporter [Pelagicoccus sp. SDUM812002]
MSLEYWYILAGVLLLSVALAGSFFRGLPLTTTMCYFLIGVACGPFGFGIVYIDPVERSDTLEHLAELAVIVSLFTAGLKLRPPLSDKRWRASARLAFGSMAITVGLVATALVLILDASWGVAILVGAVLAPTDPVLASAVQLTGAGDKNHLRFNLTAEAGLNDGTAFPFVMLGLGLLGLHDIGAGGWRWFAVDVVWAIAAGLALGWAFGRLTGELVLYLRRCHKEGIGYDLFLALGVIALSYGVAHVVHAYGFLAVFAAGVALRSTERRHSEALEEADCYSEVDDGENDSNPAMQPTRAPAHMTDMLLEWNEQVERLFEVALVLCLGIMLSPDHIPVAALWFIPLLLLVIRPISVMIGLAGHSLNTSGKLMISWLGIRGIGSFYYLMYAVSYGLSEGLSRQLLSLVVWSIAASIFVHGVTASPLMRYYGRRQ